MKGVINKGIQELVEAKFGAEAWDKVKEMAKCEEPFFSTSEDYPDQMTLDLANAASEVSGLPLETVLVEFGKFWISNTALESYPTFFKLAGKTPREFLLNMNKVHKQVTKNIRNARPPIFEYEELPDGRLLMHYRSDRRLCTVMRGLILGVGIHFDQKLQLKETSCMNNGDPQCTMEVSFP
ncbi:MAG: heme NO-binding domain-containing protein [Deltaproteobacteria bacterium]|nr:heme NO-binding domain-containing protein [Deltaproteobacteria bacterium]